VENLRTIEREGLADVEGDTGVALAAVPVAPISLQLAEEHRNLIGRSFDFLETHDIRTLALDPFLDLRLPRPDAVNVPCGEFQNRACAA